MSLVLLALLVVDQQSLWDGSLSGVRPSIRPSVPVTRKQAMGITSHIISSIWVTEIVMMKTMHFLSQYLKPIWPPGYSSRTTRDADTKPSAMYLVGPEFVSNEDNDPDSSKMAARVAILKLAFET